MNRIVGRPYLTATNGVVIEPPVFDITDLDVHTPILVSTRYRLDPAAVRNDCGLPDDCRLAVVLSVHCDLTLWAGHAIEFAESSASIEGSVEVEVPAGHGAGAVEAVTAVLLAEDLVSSDPLSASISGSVLHEGPRGRELLQGEGSHFPTDALSFTSAGRERGARWSIDYLYSSLEEPLLAGIRLLINTDTQAWKALNAPASDPLHHQVGTEMRRYVLANMVRHAVEDDAFSSGVTWPEGSVGRHFDDILTVYANGRSIEQLRTVWRTDRSRFEEILQALEADTS